jgi:hypothetical protein
MKHFTLTVQRFLHTLSTIDQVRPKPLHAQCTSPTHLALACDRTHSATQQLLTVLLASHKGPQHSAQAPPPPQHTCMQTAHSIGPQAAPKHHHCCCCLCGAQLFCLHLQDNFPEHLGCLFMINTPLLFRSFW